MTIVDETAVAREGAAGTVDVLASLSAEEITRVRELVVAAGVTDESTRFAYVGLIEPAKAEVLAYDAGTGPLPDRVARVLLLNFASGEARDLRVCVNCDKVVKNEVVDGSAGHVPILDAEFELIDPILRASEEWCTA